MRKVLILIILILIIPVLSGVAQNQNHSTLRLMKNWQIKGMAGSAMRLNDAYQARDFLEEWHRRDPQNVKVLINLANSYLKTRDYEQAGNIFASITANYPDKYPEARFYHAQILKINRDYEEALVILQTLRRRYRRLGGTGISRFRLDNEIAGCHLGIASRDTMVRTEVTWLNETINSPHIEFGPVLLGESTFVYGSANIDSSRQIPIDAPYSATRQFYEARKTEDLWHGGFSTESPFINMAGFDTGRGSFSVDRKRFYSVQCFLNHQGKNICHLYVSQLKDSAGWTEPVKLGKTVNHPSFSSTHPTVGTCFSPSLEILYFVSDRKGGGGALDIWFSVYDKRSGNYKKAENAGVFINTAQDEITPFFDLPSHQLFFSSNGWASLGGFDVFYAKGDMTTWEAPLNVGVPVNSSYDDLNFVQNYSGKFGLFASNRPGSLSLHHQACCDDLYTFNETESPRVLVTGRLIKEDVIKESGIFKPTESAMDSAVVESDVLSNQVVAVNMVKDSTSSVLIQEIQTNEQGEFEIWVDPGMDFQLTVDNASLINKSFSFTTRNTEKDQTMDVSTISLTSVNEKAILIENIYYQFNQTELTNEAKQALDTTLLLLLNNYPSIQVEISSHTDDVGDEGYNQRLSMRRANGVLQYLVIKGVDRKRMSAKGFGESQPIYPNSNNDGTDNPEGREKNRRTEFKITGLSDNTIIIHEP